MSTLVFDAKEFLAARGLMPRGAVQMAIANDVIRLMKPYTPMDTGTLSDSPKTEDGTEVVQDMPYAHYLYQGLTMGPNIPIFDDDSKKPTGFFSPPGQKKHYTGKKLTYNASLHPQAGPYWFERMKSEGGKEKIGEAAAKMAGGRYKP